MSISRRRAFWAALALAAFCPGLEAGSLAIAYTQYLWPKVQGVATVYYVIDPASDPNATPNIEAAIAISDADFPGVLQWVPWTSAAGPNYVDIDLSASDLSGTCEANEGYAAQPAQPMTGSTRCTIGTLLHEMGHVIGLLHEQTRPDRNSYVSVSYANVIKGEWPQSGYAIATDNQQTLGPYDYASVMQYIPFAFTRNGGPVIESIPAGIPLASYAGVPSQADGGGPAQPVYDYSAQDKDAVERLYGAAPTKVTVTSNPVGLSVIVDGVTVTTPQTYSWPLWSTHTLNVASEVQMLSGYVLESQPPVAATYYYTYGRWNDSTAQSHMIQVLPGDGSPRFPATTPALATYSANFVEIVPYAMSISPAATGTTTVSPQPSTYTGASGEFFVARQQVTLAAKPRAGWNFYEFNNSPFWLPGGLGANPKAFYVPDTGNAVDAIATFVNKPVYTVDVLPSAFSSNLYAYVDGQFVYTPKNYSPSHDSSWSPGSQHSIAVDAAESPYSFNSRYDFAQWSDGGAQSHDINSLPAVATAYTATMTAEYQPATNFGYPPCGGSAALSPVSTSGDGFYPSGQKLSLAETPEAGWVFGGWTYDVLSKADPASLTANGETLVYANFNTVAAPLTLTALSPAEASAGSAGFRLTLTGTGFARTSLLAVNGTYRTVTYVSADTLKVALTAADVSKAGALQVFVENFPAGWNGCAVFGYQTFIVDGAGATTVAPVLSPAAGTYGTPQAVSISDVAPDVTIYYTTDGSTPGTSSPVYSGPITVSATTTVKARAISGGFRLSSVVSGTYRIN